MIFKIMDGFWFYDVVFNGFMFALPSVLYFGRRLFQTLTLSRPSGQPAIPHIAGWCSFPHVVGMHLVKAFHFHQNKGWFKCIHMDIKPLTGSMDPLTINTII